MKTNDQKNSLDFSLDQWKSWCKLNNIQLYRAKQILEWIYHKKITTWKECNNLPRDIKDKLDQEFVVSPFKKTDVLVSKNDGTKKAVITLHDNAKIETVLIKDKQRYTVCLSSQVGCALGCKFCATGKMGFIRHLSKAEIIGQWIWASQNVPDQSKIDNVVYMGMGEPFDNYENVIGSINVLQSSWGANLGARKISISTVGINPKIKSFASDVKQIRLSLSLHAFSDKVRSSIMPINKKYPLASLKEAINYYFKKTGRKITIEYVLIKGVNDDLSGLENIIKLFGPMTHSMNIIHFNKVADVPYESCSKREIYRFAEEIEKRGLKTTIRISKGSKIQAACGQLIS